jgi:hypothetical protein
MKTQLDSCGNYYQIWCPACQEIHLILPKTATVYGKSGAGDGWNFNGNKEVPSFTPSVKIRTGYYFQPDKHKPDEGVLCHFYITNGEIRYCPDCSHDLKGQTLPLEDLEGKKLY